MWMMTVKQTMYHQMKLTLTKTDDNDVHQESDQSIENLNDDSVAVFFLT